jgi:hypothetical protein
VAGSESPEESAEAAENGGFAALTLKERIAVATAQNPTKAMSVLVLFLFSLAFFVAFVLAFPALAGVFTVGLVVLAGIAVAGYLVLNRLESG